MLMKVFRHGIGRGEKVIGYVTDSKVEKRKHSPPKVLRGDPDQVKTLIDTTSRKWRYTSGVLSWAPEDKVTPEKERELMDSFEQHAFAGMEPDQYSILWVRHSHTTHHELHFVIPRTELRSDKALNPCPPGWDKQYNPWCELWNRRNHWARPDEINRARLVSPGASIGSYRDSTVAEIRTSVTDSLLQGVEVGLIKNRTDIIATLKEVGFAVPRQGKDYLTIEIPSESQKKKQRIRLKGTLYAESWSAKKQRIEFSQSVEKSDGHRSAAVEKDNAARILKLERRVAAIHEKRALFHTTRFSEGNSRVQQASSRNLSANEKTIKTSDYHFNGPHHSNLRNSNSRHVNMAPSRKERISQPAANEQGTHPNKSATRQMEHFNSQPRRESLCDLSQGNKTARANNKRWQYRLADNGVSYDRNSERNSVNNTENRRKAEQATPRSLQSSRSLGKRDQRFQASADSLGRRFAKSCRTFRELVGMFRQVQKVRKRSFDLQR